MPHAPPLPLRYSRNPCAPDGAPSRVSLGLPRRSGFDGGSFPGVVGGAVLVATADDIAQLRKEGVV